jgi:hypothetical protein
MSAECPGCGGLLWCRSSCSVKHHDVQLVGGDKPQQYNRERYERDKAKGRKKPYPGTCVVCGVGFMSHKTGQVCCSAACRRKNFGQFTTRGGAA